MAVLVVFLLAPRHLHAQAPAQGTVTGLVTDQSTHAPLENANVVLRSRADSTQVLGTPTTADGRFSFTHVSLGSYVVECSLIGHASFRTPVFALSEANPRITLRTISLKPSALLLDKVVISSERSLFNHASDC